MRRVQPDRSKSGRRLAASKSTSWLIVTAPSGHSADANVSVRHDRRALLAESPCSAISVDLGDRIRSAANELARAVGYLGAGVVTFVHDGENFEFEAFDCVAAPDHATTEERTGASIIGWRLRVHRGEPLLGGEPDGEGVAVEARLLAVDPDDGMRPAPGVVALLSFPVGTGVRVDANRRVGDVVDASDPLLAVVTAWGPDRAVALGRVRRALDRTALVIEGGTTNRSLLLGLLAHDDFVTGHIDDAWLDRLLSERVLSGPEPVVLLAAAVEAYEVDLVHAQEAFYASAERGRPQQPAEVGSNLELGCADATYRFDVDQTGPRSYSIRSGHIVADVQVDAFGAFERRITVAGRRCRLVVSPTDTGFRVELGDTTHVVDRLDGVVVRAGWPALVVSTLVEPGDTVAAGDPVAVLESMKMETTVVAPVDGVVSAVMVTPNAQVERGAALVRLRPLGADAVSPSDDHPDGRVDLTGLKQKPDFTRKPCDRVYGPLGDYLLGYDMPPAQLRKLLIQQRRLAEIAQPGDPSLLACEDGLLDIYAELGALYRPQTASDPDDLVPTENTQEYLISFLQWLDADRAGLPAAYRSRLERALSRFGVRGLTRTPELESALMWLFRSFARIGDLSPVVIAILERRLAHRDALSARTDAAMSERLDRLAAAMQGRQQPIADLARDVRFHYFDEPPMEQAATQLYAEMSDHITHLTTHPDSTDRDERISRLVWCPQPMRSYLLESWRAATTDTKAAVHRLVLEVYIRRMYRIRALDQISIHDTDGFVYATTGYRSEDGDVSVVVGYLPLTSLPNWCAATAEQVAGLADERSLVFDVVTWRDGQRPQIDELADEVAEVIAECEFGRSPTRVDVTVSSENGHPQEHFRRQSVSFARSDDGSLTEQLLYRNLHPMLGERLEIWRLSNFRLERLASPDDVYLFNGVALSNPKDHRLFALAEIRDLVPAHDPSTGTTSYPRLERIGLQAMAAMRSELSRFAARDQPVANRLVLDVQTPWTLPSRETTALAHRFAPLAARVGLEKVVIKVRIPDPQPDGPLRDSVLQIEQVGEPHSGAPDVGRPRPGPTARRLPAEGAHGGPFRRAVPLRDRSAADPTSGRRRASGRLVRGARSRCQRSVGAGSSSAWQQLGSPRRRAC